MEPKQKNREEALKVINLKIDEIQAACETNNVNTIRTAVNVIESKLVEV